MVQRSSYVFDPFQPLPRRRNNTRNYIVSPSPPRDGVSVRGAGGMDNIRTLDSLQLIFCNKVIRECRFHCYNSGWVDIFCVAVFLKSKSYLGGQKWMTDYQQ